MIGLTIGVMPGFGNGLMIGFAIAPVEDAARPRLAMTARTRAERCNMVVSLMAPGWAIPSLRLGMSSEGSRWCEHHLCARSHSSPAAGARARVTHAGRLWALLLLVAHRRDIVAPRLRPDIATFTGGQLG